MTPSHETISQPAQVETERSEILYTAMFLTDESRQKLFGMFPPAYDEIYATHSTIAFGNNIPHSPIITGVPYELKITGLIDDGRVQVVSVLNPFSNNEYPHITISCATDPETGRPYPPRIANEAIAHALEEGTLLPVEDNVELSCVSGYFTRDHQIVTE